MSKDAKPRFDPSQPDPKWVGYRKVMVTDVHDEIVAELSSRQHAQLKNS